MAFTDEFPCTSCKRDNKDLCPFDDENGWDWSTDVVCPGFIRDGEEQFMTEKGIPKMGKMR